ncbi:hypothetical protein [Streptomyces sp. NBRC 109706]|uniref:hypothetical protein n=1 Tax=Streptomyces sp. NBRC 109706 TaxID=1550035 RepID=UPI000AA4B2D3|nr:hypothetical protein [Streptomyces sp. NBRC 109706]
MLIYLHDTDLDYAYDETDPEGLVAEFQEIADSRGIKVVSTGLSMSFVEVLSRIHLKVE